MVDNVHYAGASANQNLLLKKDYLQTTHQNKNKYLV